MAQESNVFFGQESYVLAMYKGGSNSECSNFEPIRKPIFQNGRSKLGRFKFFLTY